VLRLEKFIMEGVLRTREIFFIIRVLVFSRGYPRSGDESDDRRGFGGRASPAQPK